VSTDLRAELAEYGRSQRAERRPVDMAEILAAVDAAPESFDVYIDSAVHSVEREADGRRGDTLMFDSRWRVDESTAPAKPKRRIGALSAVAATILIVAGVIVAVDRDSNDVATSSTNATDPAPSQEEPGPSPTLANAPSLVTWSRVSDDRAGLRADGGGWMSSVVAGGPGFVAVGSVDIEGQDELSGAVWTSTDGASWSRVPHDDAIFNSGRISSVIVGGPGLVAVGAIDEHPDLSVGVGGGGDAAVWTSPDGVTWSRVSHDDAVFGGPGHQWMSDVTIGGPGLVAVGWDETNGAAVWTSADGIVWSRVPPSDLLSSRLRDTGDSMTAVTAGGPGLVAVGGLTVWTSPDGINWSEVPDDTAFSGGSGGYPKITSVTTGGPGLVAVGWIDHHAAVWTSPDGVVWSRVPHDESLFGAPISPDQLGQGADRGVRHGMTAVAAGPSGLVAVGADGPANAAPDDGIVWIAEPK
jgi:hypothetical protein